MGAITGSRREGGEEEGADPAEEGWMRDPRANATNEWVDRGERERKGEHGRRPHLVSEAEVRFGLH